MVDLDTVLFVDVETGGINPKEHSLLQVGLVLWKDGKIKDEEIINVKHDSYNVTSKALEINGIDLTKHQKRAVKPYVVPKKIQDFLARNFKTKDSNYRPDSRFKEDKVVIGGHNTSFDAGFLKENYRTHPFNYGDHFSYREVDTSAILKYLYHSGVIDEKVKSLDDALEYFDVDIERPDEHNALNCSLATAKLYNVLIELQ